MKTVLSFGHHSPSISPSPWRPLCLQKFLRVHVPLGCLKTAFVTQGLGSREFVKTMEVSIIFRLPERRNVSCRLYEIHSKANLLCNGYLSPKTWKKLIPTYYIYILCLFKVIHAIIAPQYRHRHGARYGLKSFFVYKYLWGVSRQLS